LVCIIKYNKEGKMRASVNSPIRKPLCGILLLGLVISVLCAGSPPTARAQEAWTETATQTPTPTETQIPLWTPTATETDTIVLTETTTPSETSTPTKGIDRPPDNLELSRLLAADLGSFGRGVPDGYSLVVDHNNAQGKWMIIAYYYKNGEDGIGNESLGLSRFDGAKWRVISSANPVYNEWLLGVPSSLLGEDVKPFFMAGPIDLEGLSSYSGHKLPWQGGITHQVTTGVGGHSNSVEYYAYDFGFANGTEIWSSYGGTVAYVTESFGPGACDPGQANNGNRVVVNNDDGSASLYLHLQKDGASVSVGQRVNTGDLIGYSGNSGYSCGYHLHFQVQLQGGSWWTQSQQVIFTPNGEPSVGSWPVSGNYRGGGSTCPGPSLNNPSDGFVSSGQTVNFSWSAPSGCTFEGYTFRIKDTSNMDSGGNTIVDTGNSLTSRTETIGTQWNNRDLYWGVRTANPLSPNWSVRRFRIEPGSGNSCPGPSLNNPSDGYISTGQSVSFSWNGLSGCTFNGYTFRIKDSSNMDSGGSTIVDSGEGGTGRTETIGSQWNNRDLYWGVKAANAPNGASWSVRRFRIEPGGGCSPAADQIALFVDPNYGGTCVIKGMGEYPNPASLGIANDSVSSVKVGGNVQLILCHDDNYGGGCETLTGDDSDLSSNTIGDNQVSSAKVQSRPNGYPVTLYVDYNYNGTWCALTGAAWANLCEGYDNTASSIRIQSGWSVRVWADSDRGGASRCFTGDTPDLSGWQYNENGGGSLNDSISSFMAYQQSNCPTLAPAVPSNFRVTGATSSTITVAWDDVGNENGYYIYKWQYQGGVWEFYYLTSVSANVTTFSDTSLQCGSTDYFYQVSAYNTSGESSRAGWVKGTTAACPALPDLTIANFYTSPTVATNEDLHIWAEVANQTGFAASAFWVDFYIDDQPAGCSDWGQYWTRGYSLAGYTSGYWSITVPAGMLTTGTHTVRAFVDSGCEVGEINEDNNLAGPISFTVTVPPVAPPTHDDFDAAKIIPGIPYTDNVDVRGATRAYDDPAATDCALAPGTASVWYQYTPSVNAAVYVDTLGSDYDTIIAVWTGSRGGFSPVACNDDINNAGGIFQSAVQISLTAGTTYYFEVAGWSWGVMSASAPTAAGSGPRTPLEAGVYSLDGQEDKPTPEVEAQAGGALKFHVTAITEIPEPGAFNKLSPSDSGFGPAAGLTSSWEDSSDAGIYTFCFDTTNNNACDTFWVSAGASTSIGLSGLTNNRTYYWQVRATNAAGTTEADGGAWRSFTARNQTFSDVPIDHPLWQYIEAFYDAGITTGCGVSPLIYCPEQPVTRAAMAVFLLRAKYGSGYTPPAAGHFFSDVPVAGKEWMEPWIDQLYREGITTGCGVSPRIYCPESSTTRAAMAVFILRALYGSSYTPPAANHYFSDMPVAGKEWMEPWVDELYREGITTGCGTGPLIYCPETAVKRQAMAAFIVRAFDIPLP
jgi:murein DD-endopeptidase MepM/ murein hydrolase activator NlpD